MDFWTTELISAYQTVINNIYISEGDIDGHAINVLEVTEREDSLKLYASVWEVEDYGKMVLIKAGKVNISKEPLLMLSRLLGNELNPTTFSLIQHGTTLSLEDVQTCVHRQVLRKMSEDRPYFEARGACKKVKGDLDYNGPRKLANLSLMWEKMVGNMQGIISECNGRITHEMVKGAVKCVNAKPVKNVAVEMKKHKKCCIESCNAFVHTICK